jgi:hypothetical protein
VGVGGDDRIQARKQKRARRVARATIHASAYTVSLEMVRLYKEHFGRPKLANTHWTGPEALVVF